MANKFKHIQEVPNTVDHSTRVFLTSLRNAVRQIAVVVEDQAAATTTTAITANTSPQVPSAMNPGVTNLTGLLTLHAVLLGNDGTDIRAMAGLGTDGQYLRSYGAGNDPNWASIAEAEVTGLVADLASKALATRLISTTAPLTGGGNLTADRTLAVSIATVGAVGVVKPDGTTIGIAVDGTISALGGGTGTVTHASSALTASAVILGNGGADIKPIGSLGTGGQYLRSGGAGVDPAFAAITEAEVTNLTTDLALKAPLASPALTGTPTAPTPAGGDSSTKIATTQFVQNFAPGGAGSLTLKTNGVADPTQTLLDFLNGLGILITDDGSGHTTIARSGFELGGDGADGALVFDGIATVLGITPLGATITLSAVATASGGIAVYTTTASSGTNDAFAGMTFVVTGFANGVNNGTFICVASGNTTLNLLNVNAIAETHAGTAISGGLYLLTREVFATNLTVNAGVYVGTNSWRIFCTGTATVNGILYNDGAAGKPGANGSGSAGGAGGTAGHWTSSPTSGNGSMPVTVAGTFPNGNPTAGAGGSGTATVGGAGVTGGTLTASISAIAPGGATGSAGANGGAGGTGTGGAAGALGTGSAGKTVTAATTIGRIASCHWPNFFDVSGTSTIWRMYNGACGGAGGGSAGGGNATAAGGGGGGGGGTGGYAGYLFLSARKIVVGASGRISSNGGDGGKGGNGANGVASNCGGGGGGGGGTGGGGGILYLLYQKLANGGTISANGGAGGALGTHGNTGGGSGVNGSDGQVGTNGQAGIVIQIQC